MVARPTVWINPNGGPVLTRSGVTYTPDVNGHISAPTLGTDAHDLVNAGAYTIQLGYIGKLTSANFNITTDQAIPLYVPSVAKFRLTRISVTNASLSMTTAAGGVYPAASKGGTATVAAGQAYSALTTALLALDLTLAAAARVYDPTTLPVVNGLPSLYLSLTTGQGVAATADIYVFGDIYE